jgi:hypothetical protein
MLKHSMMTLAFALALAQPAIAGDRMDTAIADAQIATEVEAARRQGLSATATLVVEAAHEGMGSLRAVTDYFVSTLALPDSPQVAAALLRLRAATDQLALTQVLKDLVYSADAWQTGSDRLPVVAAGVGDALDAAMARVDEATEALVALACSACGTSGDFGSTGDGDGGGRR